MPKKVSNSHNVQRIVMMDSHIKDDWLLPLLQNIIIILTNYLLKLIIMPTPA